MVGARNGLTVVSARTTTGTWVPTVPNPVISADVPTDLLTVADGKTPIIVHKVMLPS